MAVFYIYRDKPVVTVKNDIEHTLFAKDGSKKVLFRNVAQISSNAGSDYSLSSYAETHHDEEFNALNSNRDLRNFTDLDKSKLDEKKINAVPKISNYQKNNSLNSNNSSSGNSDQDTRNQNSSDESESTEENVKDNSNTEAQTPVNTIAVGTTSPVAPTTSTAPTTPSNLGSGAVAIPSEPKIFGSVEPLSGVITSSHFQVPLIKSAWSSNTCTNPRVLLFDLVTKSVLSDNPISEDHIDAETKFEFNPKELNVDLNIPTRYLLKTVGCEKNYERIITNFYSAQDLTAGTTLISKTLNASISLALNEISVPELEALIQKLNTTTLFETEVSASYDKLEASNELTNAFSIAFGGVAPVVLKDAAPEISSYTIPKIINEKTPATYTIQGSHWNSEYIIGYEWYIDNQLVSNSNSFQYTPPANSANSIQIKIVIGKKNINDSNVDRSKPFHEITSATNINDTFPVLPPTIQLASSAITNQNSIDLLLSTGISEGSTFLDCETFSSFAIKESLESLLNSDFTYNCSAPGNQTFNYDLLFTNEGTKNLYVYAKDKRNNISVANLVTFVLDKTAPTLSFETINGFYKANKTHPFTVRVSELNSINTETLNIELYDGAAWIPMNSEPVPSGILADLPVVFNVQLPNTVLNNARLRASFRDAAGNSTTLISSNFNIVKPIINLSPALALLNDTLSLSTGSSQTITLTNSGLVDSDNCSTPTLTGISADQFVIQAENCTNTILAASGQCQIDVLPTPQSKGIKEAYLTLSCGLENSNATLRYTSTNNIPTSPANQFINLDEDSTLNFNVSSGFDLDSDVLTYDIVTNTTQGTLSNCLLSNGDLSCTYQPNSNFNGSDSFSYSIYDGEDNAISNAQVFITINPINDAPVMLANQTISANEEEVLNFTLNGASDIDLPAQTLSYKIITAPLNGALSNCINNSTYVADKTCTYTPNPNFNGVDSFTYEAYDGVTNSSTVATVTFNVTAVNDAPTLIANQSISTSEDTVLNFSILEGTDTENDALAYIVVTPPASGTLTCTGGSSRDCQYTPALNFNGNVTFTYKVNDGSLDSNLSTVTINVLPVNDAPLLSANQNVATNEDTLLNFSLNSGSDVDGDSLTYEVVSLPANGTLLCTGGLSQSCSFNPSANFNGTTSFSYRVNDGILSSPTATVTITVNAVNDAPTLAVTQSVSTNEDTDLTFDLALGNDTEGQSLTYIATSTPSNGTLNCTGGVSRICSFSPAANFNGTTSFTYKVNDGSLDSNSATVTITVNPINDAPTIPATQSVATSEETPVAFELNTGSDIENQTLSYIKLTNPASGTLTCTGGTSTNCSFTPALDFIGTVSFTYKVNDGSLDSNTATVSILVTNTNDAPVMAGDQSFNINEDNALALTLNGASDIDVPAQTLQYIVISPPANGILSQCITTGSYGTDLTCTYTPNANFYGVDSFTYKAYDGISQSNMTSTVTFNVASINDAPVVGANQSITTNEDTLVNFTLNAATDVDIPVQALSYKMISAPTNGTLSNCINTSTFVNDLTCTYTPNANFNGADSFTVQAYDTVTTSVTNATINITVNAINDAPTLASTQTVSTNEDTVLNFNLNAGTDTEGSTLTYIKLTDPASGTLSCTGGISRACTYTPVANYNGSVSFTYKTNDGSLDSNTATVTINVTAVNDAPTLASTQSLTTAEDTVLNFNLNAGTDVEGSTLTYVKLTDPASGTLTCTGGTSRACVYTPVANYNGSVTFTYKANDGTADSNIATVTIDITAVNDAPTLAATQTVSTNEDTALTFDLTAGSDTEGSALTYVKLTNPASGTLTCTGGTSRSCTYTPVTNYNGSVNFTYKVNDGSLDSTVSTVTINVTAVNDTPTLAATQAVSTAEDTVLNFNLTAGSDVDGDTLNYNIITTPASGTLSCTGGSSRACTYTPALNFNGTTTFTYRVNDGLLNSTTSTVTITVSAVNDAPTLAATQSVTTNEDTALNFNLTAGTDTEGSTLSYVILTSPASGTLSCTGGSSQACLYTPAANVNGAVTFTYKVNDGALDSTTATVTINITAVNDAPTLAATQAVSTNEDTALTFDLAIGTDIEGSSLTYTKLTNPASGTLTCTGGTSRSCTYTPVANYNGSVSFTYKVNDGLLDSNTATVTITINAVNDRPVTGATQSFTTNDNTALNFTVNAGSDIDIPAQTLRYKIITAPTNGTITNCMTTGAYSTDLTCTYTSNANFEGTDSFTYVVNDTVIDSLSTQTITFTVNDATRPLAPAVILASNSYTNSLNSSFTATNCSDTPFIFINEGTEPLAGAAGWVNCSTTAGALTYTMSAGAGTKTVKLWSKDANGNVSSTSSNFTIVYETTAPTLAITSPTYVKGGAVYAIQWTATEANVTTSQNFTIEYYNGSTWSAAGTLPSTNGPLSATAFSFNWTAPSVNIATARLRVSLTDRAGNSATATSNAFTIDSIAPTIAITTPANNTYYATTNATITGTCEGTLPITFSGALQSSFNVNCASGSFTQNVNFSNGDGQKDITLTITDLAGNQTSLTRTLFQDTTAPYLTKTTGANPQYTKNNTVTWGGTCEGNLTINFTGSSTGSFNCVSGAWTWTVPSKTVDGNYSYSLQQVDSASNTSTSLSLAWTRDNVAPTLTVAQGTTATNNLSAMTFSGNCEGVLPITVSGTESDTFSCNNGSWSYTTNTYSTDATRSFTFTQTDIATNATVRNFSWTRNTQGPALYLTSTNPLKTNSDTVTFSGTCQTGLTINITGTTTSSTTCPAGTWTWTTPSITTDGTKTFTFSQTNAVPNTTSVVGTWYRKTTLPTVSAFSTTASNPSRNATIPTTITANSGSSTVLLSEVCTVSDDSTLPTANHICWEPINGPVIAKSLAQTMTITGYPHLLGWEVRAYTVYVWVKDEAGNISNLTSSGVGTLATDKFNSFYDPGITPVVADVWAANVTNAANPPTIAQSTIPAGQTVYIHWKATDNTALPAGAISLFYTQDEINFLPVAGANALNNQNYNCTGLTLGANEGCFKWTNGSPLNTAYKIQVVVNDQTDLSSKLISNPLNTGQIKILAGNTESGLGGSAQSALFFNRKNGGEPDLGTLVMTNDGRIYFADYKRGIITVDPADGNQKVFIPMTGTSTGDGGPAANATLRYPTKIVLDYQNRLLIMDTDRIRRVDLNLSTPTIETIIGGGTDTADTVAVPTNVKIYAHSSNSYTAKGMVFFATPNGDIYFHSDYAQKDPATTTYRLRVYKAATGKVLAKNFSLTSGDWFAPSTPLSGCRLMNPSVSFDPATSALTGVSVITQHHGTWASCDDGSGTGDGRYSRAYFNPTTFAQSTNHDDSFRWVRYLSTTGMDGNSYINVERNYVNRVNFDGTYTRVLGSGTRGICADGTPALTCNVDIQDYFVNAQGKVYFVDGSLIRTIDDNGNVVTLFGQRNSYGDNINALNSRFDDIFSFGQTNDGKIIVGDNGGYYLKEFTIEGNINIIAGNGNYASTLNTTSAPTAQGMYTAAWFLVDPSNGDIFIRNHYYRVAKFNRSTNLYENIIGCGAVAYWDADGQVGTVKKCNGNQSYVLPIGFGNNKLVTSNMKYNNTGLHYEDFMLKSYDKATSFTQSHLAGTNDPLETYSGGYQGICTSGSPAASCKMPYYDYYNTMTWDGTGNRWIMNRTRENSSTAGREMWSIVPGGNATKIAQLGRNVGGYVFVRDGANQHLYYCSGGRLYRHNMANDTDLGALTWSMATMTCKGGVLQWNATRRTVIFAFEQNGLDGIAEYYVP